MKIETKLHLRKKIKYRTQHKLKNRFKKSLFSTDSKREKKIHIHWQMVIKKNYKKKTEKKLLAQQKQMVEENFA